ncbi:LysE family translocator [Actinacidiphila oryziradicis]|uniref:LysE family translocator n=1 Tax=Actinacidiphila oryziradicis TaxID=2571141 RepID=A0A4U0T0T3_9ACTN|nr:LysE family translocator [Actinacidiphila oryziradicis]TKA06355.1 LysE family translocator [Actinacidiphila oryziradicis]
MGAATAFWSFAVVVGLLTLTPGLDTALILRTAARGRRREAWGVVLGIQTGTLIWGTLSSLGVTALLAASHAAYDAVRLAGAAYLLWMGALMLWSSLRRRHGVAESHAAEGERTGATAGLSSGWRRGALTNVLNPKIGVFYVAVLPQFIPASAPHLAMGVALTCVHVGEGLAWSSILVAFAQVLRGWLRRPVAQRVLDRITGTVIVGFGVKLAIGD